MINLLPKNSKHASGRPGFGRKLAVLYIFVTVIIGGGAFGLAAYNQWLALQNTGNQAELNELKQRRVASTDLVAAASAINERIKNEAKYRDKRDWPEILDLAAAVTPTDVRLTGLKFAGEATLPLTITLTGETGSRRSIVLLKDKLANQPGVNAAEITAMARSLTNSVSKFTFTVTASYNAITSEVKK